MEKKKYFIGFVLSPEADRYARMIADDLSERYLIKNQFEKYVPHITLKIPFTGLAVDREKIIEFLQKFVKGRKDIPIVMSDFGHFNIGVVYWDVLQHSEALTTLQKELCDAIQTHLQWVSFNPVEPNGIPHVTVGEGDIKGRFQEIYKYLKKNYTDPKYVILNEMHLFEEPLYGYKWKTAAAFRLKPSF